MKDKEVDMYSNDTPILVYYVDYMGRVTICLTFGCLFYH